MIKRVDEKILLTLGTSLNNGLLNIFDMNEVKENILWAYLKSKI